MTVEAEIVAEASSAVAATAVEEICALRRAAPRRRRVFREADLTEQLHRVFGHTESHAITSTISIISRSGCSGTGTTTMIVIVAVIIIVIFFIVVTAPFFVRAHRTRIRPNSRTRLIYAC